MAYMKNLKFDYRSNGELKCLDFKFFFSHSGIGNECIFGKNHRCVDFRNAWRNKTGLPKQGRWNPGRQGVMGP